MNKKYLILLTLSLALSYKAKSEIKIPNIMVLKNGDIVENINFTTDEIPEFTSDTNFNPEIEKISKNIIKYGKLTFDAQDFLSYIINETFDDAVLSDEGIIKLMGITINMGICYYVNINDQGIEQTFGEITNPNLRFLIKLRRLTFKIIKTKRLILKYKKLSEQEDLSLKNDLENLRNKLKPLLEEREKLLERLRILNKKIDKIKKSMSDLISKDESNRKKLITKASSLKNRFTKAQKEYAKSKIKEEEIIDPKPKQENIIKRVFNKIFNR
ncbi:hypothetical protein GF385_00665 [Candidatus Dependentiae bacterium]|nr:hypothetical protein [Candidatus Dependentiae bacterium]